MLMLMLMLMLVDFIRGRLRIFDTPWNSYEVMRILGGVNSKILFKKTAKTHLRYWRNKKMSRG